ncbi:MAG: AcrR family transcriptional regulator [Parvibaculaceae bacterium]|nr:TetR/AcrR family transcriptional regulator [Parvibaculaceae bacterium]
MRIDFTSEDEMEPTTVETTDSAETKPMSVADRRLREFARRENEILQAALSLFDGDDWEHVTIDKIAAKAEIGKGTVYKHFVSKDEIYARLAIRLDQDLLAHLSEIDDTLPALSQLKAFIVHYWAQTDLDMAQRNLAQFCGREAFRNRLSIVTRAEWGGIEHAIRDQFIKILQQGMSEEIFRPLPDDLLLQGPFATLHGAVRLSWRNGAGAGRPERLDELIHYIVLGIATKPGRKLFKKGL